MITLHEGVNISKKHFQCDLTFHEGVNISKKHFQCDLTLHEGVNISKNTSSVITLHEGVNISKKSLKTLNSVIQILYLSALLALRNLRIIDPLL